MVKGRIQVSRVERPTLPNLDQVDHLVGAEWKWGWAIPHMYRALHASGIGNPMPAAPTRTTDLFDALGYWNALQHMLSFSMGWARHDRGLRAWYDAGKPTGDDRLALLAAVWDSDGSLDPYVWWSHEHIEDNASILGKEVRERDVLSEVWGRRLRSWAAPGCSPMSPDQKHLEGIHASGPMERGQGEVRWHPDHQARRATLVVDDARGWLRALHQLGDELPLHRKGAWRVDVVAKPIGFLGTYRRSWETDLWFAGSHRVHLMGN